MVGYLGCRVCKKQFSATISGNYFNIELSAPVDVYCEWIDACENVNK
jgi:transcription elongation factor Elf1